jgi:hypothetical protein
MSPARAHGVEDRGEGLRWRLGRRGVVVHVRLLAVLPLLVILTVVVAVRQRAVVVLVGVPERPVLPLGDRKIASMMMRNVVVIVRVGALRVHMLRLVASIFGALRCHGLLPPNRYGTTTSEAFR